MSTPWGLFFPMLRFKVHMLGKSSGLPQNDKMHVPASRFFLIFLMHGYLCAVDRAQSSRDYQGKFRVVLHQNDEKSKVPC